MARNEKKRTVRLTKDELAALDFAIELKKRKGLETLDVVADVFKDFVRDLTNSPDIFADQANDGDLLVNRDAETLRRVKRTLRNPSLSELLALRKQALSGKLKAK